MGSTRVVIDGTGTVTSRTDNDAWGETIWQNGTETRLSYIDKEKDKESGDHNFGVRQYSPKYGGRFESIDPDWEKYRAYSPYNYAENNPLRFKDPSGYGPGDVSRMQPAWTNEYSGGFIGGSGGNGGVSIGQIVGAAVAGVLGYVFAENVVGSEAEQPGTSTTGQNKSNSIDWVKNPPKDPAALGDEWEETTNPQKKKNISHSTDYTNKNTGEVITFDKAQPGESGWEGKDHWHRHNPDSQNPKKDKYLDQNGKPTGKGTDKSHIPAGSN